MSLSRTEELTYRFYEWEKRGRGWDVFGKPVELEPKYEPFYHHIPTAVTYVDDGKRPSIFAAPFEAIGKLFNPPKAKEQVNEEPVLALPFQSADVGLRCITVSFPKDAKIQVQPMEQLLTVLSTSAHPISFEIIATGSEIRQQFVCRTPDILFIKSQVKAYFPDCILEDRSEGLAEIAQEDLCTAVIDLGLREEFMRPIAQCDRLDLDPLTGIFGLLEQLEGNEKGAIQIQGVSYPWAQSIIASVSDNRGECFFADAPEMLDLAQEKVSSPLYAVVVRAIGQSDTYEEAEGIAAGIARMIEQVSQSASNMLVPLQGYYAEAHLYNVLERCSHRTGMILNSHELLTLVHFPSQSVVASKLLRDITKTKIAPAMATGHQFILGTNIHQGRVTTVSVTAEQRLKHTHVIGATGTGKSTLLLSLIIQDIQQGNGVAVLDPHGDLIESVLPYLPENRYSDVIMVDPADSAFPVGFNILTAHSEVEKEILASDLVAVFRRLSTSFGDQMHSVLANAILAFLESSRGGTLLDLRRFLIEKQYRDEFLKTVSDPNIVYYWQKEYPLLKSSSIGPILTRLDSFLRPKVIRNMVAQRKSLDFENILDSKKILFIKLSQGLIGTENSYLLGTFFVSKIYQAAMARQAQAKGDRKDFFLYIDEFQNFITPSMSSILSGTRKYGLGCIFAHQDMIQLQKQDGELASAVISNAGTRVCFRLGDIDAKRFEDGFSSFEAKDLQNLGVGQAIVRIERPEYDFNISVVELKEPDVTIGAREKVIARSREQYGTPRQEVEKTLEYLRGEEQRREIQITPDEFKAAEPLKKQPPLTEAEKPASVSEIPALDEQQKAKTVENLARQKELSQHRYLQTLIKRMAEARGYKATIEEPTPDGKGLVDVSLEKNRKRIACEIGVTTTKEWEVHNIEKCLNAGYEMVIAVPIDRKAVEVMQKQIVLKLDTKFHSRVLVMEADALFHYLDTEVAKEATTETRMKGYRVKVEYDTVSEEEMKRKRESVAKVVADTVKKPKNIKK